MLPSEYETQDCSVARALEAVGERWTLLIVRDALHGVTRYDDFLARLGVPTTTLSRRLTLLVKAGIFRREQYEDRPARFSYHLTGKGRDLVMVVAALREWGDRHRSPGGASAEYRHRGCGGATVVTLRCEGCREQVTPQDVERVERRPIRRT